MHTVDKEDVCTTGKGGKKQVELGMAKKDENNLLIYNAVHYVSLIHFDGTYGRQSQ